MRGYTLMELATVLTLMAVGASAAVPTVRRFGDRAAVVVAREQVVGAVAEARGLALASGGSRVTIVEAPAVARIEASGRPLLVRSLDPAGRVAVDVRAPGDSIVLRFDALGIGRFTSRTVSLARGRAVGAVVISSYGRVRRR